jgi:hypothetical protein
MIMQMHKSCVVYFEIKKLVIITNIRTQVRKSLFFYYKTNGIIFIQKKWMEIICLLPRNLKIKMNHAMKQTKKTKPTKKIGNIFGGSISKKLLWKIPSKKRMCHIKNSLRTLVF